MVEYCIHLFILTLVGPIKTHCSLDSSLSGQGAKKKASNLQDDLSAFSGSQQRFVRTDRPLGARSTQPTDIFLFSYASHLISLWRHCAEYSGCHKKFTPG